VAVWRVFSRPVRYAALVAGVLPALAFPAPNLEFVAWFGLVPGMLLMRSAPSAREAAARGWWFGTGFLLASLYWLSPNLGPGLLLVVAIIGALWTGFGAATWGLLRPPITTRRALAALAVVPSCWLVADWVRSWQGFGGPWAVYGASQWQHPAILALAALGGVWLVSFALVAANTGILIAIAAQPAGVRMIGAASAAVAIAAGPAAFALTAASPVSRNVTVAVVQPAVVHNPTLSAYASQRLSAGLRHDHADLIVWGESSVAVDLSLPSSASRLRPLEALSAGDEAQLLVNQDSIVNGNHSKVALLIGSNGIDGRYVKTRLVPFGEYIPFRQQLGWLTKISKAASQNMVPGTGAHVLKVTTQNGPPLTIGVLICFESAFPDMSRVDTDNGAQLIVYQTSDSTWQEGWEWVQAQHAALGALRAAETGRPVVQAALTGDSVAFDARGRLLMWKGSSFRGVAVQRLGLPPVSARTLYDQLGDYVPWTAVAIAALAAIIALIRTGQIGRLRVSRHSQARIPLDGNPRRDPSAVGGPDVSATSPPPARQRWRLATVAIFGAVGLAVAACSGGGTTATSGGQASSKPTPAGLAVSITPANGSGSAAPSQGITVTASKGKLSHVTVTTSGDPVSGTMNSAGTVWHSGWALDVSQSYTVTAKAEGTSAAGTSGKTLTQTSSFKTLTPSQTFSTTIFEGSGQSYGVGMPIILYFSHPITNKAAVERAFQVTSSKPIVGSWYWENPCNMAPTCAYFRPQNYWPAHTQVGFTGHLNGVEGAPGVYGDHTLSQSFSIGDSLIVVASTASHHMELYRNGALLDTWPISTGRPGLNTPNGTYLTIDKGNPVDMKGPGYNEKVPWSVRFTWTGDYLHDAFWSVGEQGNTNVSHGCVNMPPADAEAYYKMEVPGDPVTVTGSPKSGIWDNGWTEWFLPWAKYVQGSALGQAVEAGPDGSTFVSPSAVPASSAAAPLGAPDPHNWQAS
jgi:apolipoprotein N-acyltransferase